MTPEAFAAALRGRGIELVLRRNRLAVWPVRAYRLGLVDAERDYLAAHRDELKELVRGGLPETTVAWREPGVDEAQLPPDRATRLEAELDLARRDAALREQNLDAWLVVHGNEPEAAAARDAEATAVMRRMVGRRSAAYLQGAYE